ncbi:MAG: AraC family transcriptional regulator [Kiloniellales bacterium]|nr:AraC family transcriptional regulator [Kiloniellales bacterium]
MAKPVERALWTIEHRLGEHLSLRAVADASGVSPFHLTRVFAGATGLSVMRYVRARRLSEAARRLARDDADILSVALEAGYASHEAFTRAFREQFGLVPEAARAARSVENLRLVEPIRMNDDLKTDLQAPRIEQRPGFRVAGLSERYTFETNQGIPALWKRFAPHIGHLPGQVDAVTYGVCYNVEEDGGFDYLASVEVAHFDDLPPELDRLTIEPQNYAVFEHRGHVAEIRRTVHAIWNGWLPKAAYRQAKALDFERYDGRFDPATGEGVVEIWVPIEAR